MYKVAKLKVLSKITDKKDAIIHLDGLLSMLYKNGQILNHWIIEEYPDYLEVRVTITDDDSLNSKYFNRYIVKELEKKVDKPVYLLVANPIGGYFEFEKNNKNLECCPKCGGEFKYINNDYADKVCDICRLAFITHEE